MSSVSRAKWNHCRAMFVDTVKSLDPTIRCVSTGGYKSKPLDLTFYCTVCNHRFLGGDSLFKLDVIREHIKGSKHRTRRKTAVTQFDLKSFLMSPPAKRPAPVAA